jgi:20S proteasome alpha/beta subunit
MDFLLGFLISKNKFTFNTIFVVIFCSIFANATTILTLVTPEAIVIGADSKNTPTYCGGYKKDSREEPIDKVIIVHKRIAIASVGLESSIITDHSDHVIVAFNRESLIKQIEDDTPPDIPIALLAQIVEEKSAVALIPLGPHVKAGIAEYDKSSKNATLVATSQFIIVGYDDGVATLREINFDFDWERGKFLPPTINLIFPSPTARPDFGFHVNGAINAVEDILHRELNSKAYRGLTSLSVKSLDHLIARKNLTIDEAVALLSDMLRQQSKYTPDIVGAPFVVTVIHKTGPINVVRYPQ